MRMLRRAMTCCGITLARLCQDSTIYIADYQNHRIMKWREGSFAVIIDPRLRLSACTRLETKRARHLNLLERLAFPFISALANSRKARDCQAGSMGWWFPVARETATSCTRCCRMLPFETGSLTPGVQLRTSSMLQFLNVWGWFEVKSLSCDASRRGSAPKHPFPQPTRQQGHQTRVISGQNDGIQLFPFQKRAMLGISCHWAIESLASLEVFRAMAYFSAAAQRSWVGICGLNLEGLGVYASSCQFSSRSAMIASWITEC